MSRKSGASPFEKLPIEMLLYQAQWLNLDDYRNYIRARFPYYDEPQIIKEKFWQMSLYRTKTKFLNGETLDIEYNFDTSREEGDEIYINMSSLVSVFGNIRSDEMSGYMSLSVIENFVEMHVHLNKCSGARFASCSCHLPKDAKVPPASSGDGCRYKHSHHYCSKHVQWWLKFSLKWVIREDRSGDPLSDENINELIWLGRMNSFREKVD